MTIAGRIEGELKKALLDRDSQRANILKMLKTALQYAALSRPDKTLTDSGEEEVLKKEQKKRLDAAKLYEDNSQPQKAQSERAEADVIAEFLPEPLSESETNQLVAVALEETGATELKDIGRVIALVKEKSEGQADSGLVASLVKEKLS